MRVKSIALAAVPAALLGVMAAAPTASAWAPGNCPQDKFCTWQNYWYGDTDETPSLTIDSDWSGSAPAHIFYNNTSRAATMTYVLQRDGGQGRVYTDCVGAKGGSYFVVPVFVTDVTWSADGGSSCL
ncbi:hypothetical protein [Streptomyces minutiscleroticus]|uniref:Peptidase inhibitor family I36 n=1 Tax=Streptomyces minutiscleroticus TaxID=68238 RepID=A0A918KKG8_9ACTN|nr:hypothetical protein [Streptomyces minutiscleroticus]GGX66791.1 hypothetical protein GCM10010358_21630 [Streptomyces minutiscleroticus]